MEQGAELVELRLDYISSRVNIQRLLKDRPCPTVITVRREQDGGKYTGSEEARLIMLREAIANGVEYVDLEDDVAEQDSAVRQDEADHQLSQLSQHAGQSARAARAA